MPPSRAGARREQTTEGAAATGDRGEARAYLSEVMAEIDAEVRERRASGDLPARVERELDALFLPVLPGGRAGRLDLADALRMVDASAYIDPVVPVGSASPVGPSSRRASASSALWYVGVDHRSGRRVRGVGDPGPAHRRRAADRAPAPARRPAAWPRPRSSSLAWAHGPGAWWAAEAPAAVAAGPGPGAPRSVR